MPFNKKTINDVPLDGQPVLVRADYNVPIENSHIIDDYRIKQSLPTLKHLLTRGCSIIICSHLGRPKGKPDPSLSLKPIADRLGELLNLPVEFVSDCIGEDVRQQSQKLGTGQILLLENLRFHPEEKNNDPDFAEKLIKDTGAAYFVQDGFGVVHRAHASTDAITKFAPSIAGLLLEREVSTITDTIKNPKKPLVAILGGAKVADKVKMINNFINIADKIIIGGAMANTFLQYKGQEIGQSIHEDGLTEEIKDIYTRAINKISGKISIDDFLILPIDATTAKSLDKNAPNSYKDINSIEKDDYILDIGTRSAIKATEIIKDAQTVIWNGTLGMAEIPAYAKASQTVSEAIASQPEITSIIGGGDTIEFILSQGEEQSKKYSIISTGGGASLALMAGEKLPGLDALENK